MKSVFLIVLLVNILFAYLWSIPRNLGIAGADDINPQACRMQSNSRTCCVWQTNLDDDWDVFSRIFSGTWGDTVRVTNDTASGIYHISDINPSVAYDYFRDCFWCVWQNNSTGNWDIFVSQGLSNWSMSYQLTTSPLDDELPSVYANIDTVWIVWRRTGVDSKNIYSAYYDGSNWSAPIAVTKDSAGISNVSPKMSSRHNHPFVVWEREGDIYYCEYRNGLWQSPHPITVGPSNDCKPEVNSLSKQYAHVTYGTWVVWQTDHDNNYEIYATAYDTLDIFYPLDTWYRLTINDSADVTPSPLFYYVNAHNRDSLLVTAFSTNRNGNYDIYTTFDFWGEVPVDITNSEDVFPVMSGNCDYVWVLWQTNRNGDWDVYGSFIYVVGTEESNASSIRSPGGMIISPNPFSEMTDIRYQTTDDRLLIGDNRIQIKIYNSAGRLVKDLSLLSAYSLLPTTITWNGTDNSGQRLPQGIYFVQLQNHTEILTEKAVLMK